MTLEEAIELLKKMYKYALEQEHIHQPMEAMEAMKDGTLLAYIEGFYEAADDHIRAMYGAYIVGYLEAIFGLTLSVKEDGKSE